METQTAKARTGTQRDVHQIISGRVIELLEKGIVPWRIPWTQAGVPKNLITGRAYRGINTMLLASLGYERNLFLTSKQLKEIGAFIRPEEKPHLVTYWSYGDREKEPKAPEETKKPGVLRYYTVYNIAQCAGIPEELVPPVEPVNFPVLACEAIVKEMSLKPDIRHKDPEAYYDCLDDYINMPKQKSFVSDEVYYSVLFHELAHSTGHHTRLDRMGLVQMSEYGGNEFSQEELIAEIATGYLHSLTGITGTFKHYAEHIEGWAGRMRCDKHLAINAATQAQRAVDFILNVQSEDKEPVEEPSVA